MKRIKLLMLVMLSATVIVCCKKGAGSDEDPPAGTQKTISLSKPSGLPGEVIKLNRCFARDRDTRPE